MNTFNVIANKGEKDVILFEGNRGECLSYVDTVAGLRIGSDCYMINDHKIVEDVDLYDYCVYVVKK